MDRASDLISKVFCINISYLVVMISGHNFHFIASSILSKYMQRKVDHRPPTSLPQSYTTHLKPHSNSPNSPNRNLSPTPSPNTNLPTLNHSHPHPQYSHPLLTTYTHPSPPTPTPHHPHPPLSTHTHPTTETVLTDTEH